jgi:hypothetical protein
LNQDRRGARPAPAAPILAVTNTHAVGQ